MRSLAVWLAEVLDIGEQAWNSLEEKGAQVSLYPWAHMHSHENMKQAQGTAALAFLSF